MIMSELQLLAALVRKGEVSAVELVGGVLSRIEQADEQLNAIVHVDADGAMRAAADVDRRLASGEDLGPLAGIPFGVKDLDDAAGMPTARGSRWFVDRPPVARDDIHVARLRRAGAIPIAKTATPEFGSAAITSSLVHGVTRNPWALSRTPGGSSGGTAAAVAMGMIPFGTASDGGGSIRSPAGFCGLPGLRPTYGRVATFASTHVAQNAVNFALATSAVDTALLLDICAGPDLFDRTSLPSPDVRYLDAVESLPTAGLRVAYSPCFGFGPVEREVGEVVTAALDQLVQSAGLQRVDLDVELPFFFETYSKLEGVDRWVDLPDGLWPERAGELGPELQAGWASGHRARLPQLGAVYTARRALEHQVAHLFTEIDVLVTPTTGVAAFAAEGPLPELIDGQTVHPFVGLAQPILASVCNLPAMSLPAGLTSDGRPVGLQVIAHRFREDVCLRLAQLLEEATGRAVPPDHLGPFDSAMAR